MGWQHDSRAWRELETDRTLVRQSLSTLLSLAFLPLIWTQWNPGPALLRGWSQDPEKGREQRMRDALDKQRSSSKSNQVIKMHCLLWATVSCMFSPFWTKSLFKIHYFLHFALHGIEINSMCLYQRPLSQQRSIRDWVQFNNPLLKIYVVGICPFFLSIFHSFWETFSPQLCMMKELINGTYFFCYVMGMWPRLVNQHAPSPWIWG